MQSADHFVGPPRGVAQRDYRSSGPLRATMLQLSCCGHIGSAHTRHCGTSDTHGTRQPSCSPPNACALWSLHLALPAPRQPGHSTDSPRAPFDSTHTGLRGSTADPLLVAATASRWIPPPRFRTIAGSPAGTASAAPFRVGVCVLPASFGVDTRRLSGIYIVGPSHHYSGGGWAGLVMGG